MADNGKMFQKNLQKFNRKLQSIGKFFIFDKFKWKLAMISKYFENSLEIFGEVGQRFTKIKVACVAARGRSQPN